MFPDDDVDVFETRSPAMRRVLAEAARAAPLETSVLINGETGVGKRRLARWIHAHSTRADRPFVPVDCCAFLDMRVDGDLLDGRRGPFSGVVRGIFDAAGDGTLFLDDIDEASKALQVELVRAIEAPLPQSVGDVRRQPPAVRVIAATTRNLIEEVEQEQFYPDLLFRLRGVALHVPPLRERNGDVWSLAEAMLARAAASGSRPIDGFAPHAMVHLIGHEWLGNLRELHYAIEHACAIATGPEIQLNDLPETLWHGCVPTSSECAGRSRTSPSGMDGESRGDERPPRLERRKELQTSGRLEDLVRLDRLVHEPARLAILTALTACRTADALFLQSITGLALRQLYAHLRTLAKSGLIAIDKRFKGTHRETWLEITAAGDAAFHEYWRRLEASMTAVKSWRGSAPPLRSQRSR
jgi:DNA-binding NtrC family response regulator